MKVVSRCVYIFTLLGNFNIFHDRSTSVEDEFQCQLSIKFLLIPPSDMLVNNFCMCQTFASNFDTLSHVKVIVLHS